MASWLTWICFTAAISLRPDFQVESTAVEAQTVLLVMGATIARRPPRAATPGRRAGGG